MECRSWGLPRGDVALVEREFGSFGGKRGGAMPGAEAGEEPFDEELVAATDAGFEPQPLSSQQPEPVDPVKLAAIAAAAAAAKAIEKADLFWEPFALSTTKNRSIDSRSILKYPQISMLGIDLR